MRLHRVHRLDRVHRQGLTRGVGKDDGGEGGDEGVRGRFGWKEQRTGKNGEEGSVVEMWSHNVVDSMTCAGSVERRRGLKRLVLTRGVEKKSMEGTMTKTTLTEDVSNSCHSSVPRGMSEGAMAFCAEATWLREVPPRTCLIVNQKIFIIPGPSIMLCKRLFSKNKKHNVCNLFVAHCNQARYVEPPRNLRFAFVVLVRFQIPSLVI